MHSAPILNSRFYTFTTSHDILPSFRTLAKINRIKFYGFIEKMGWKNDLVGFALVLWILLVAGLIVITLIGKKDHSFYHKKNNSDKLPQSKFLITVLLSAFYLVSIVNYSET